MPHDANDLLRKALAKDARTSREIAEALDIHPVNVRKFAAGTMNLSPEKLASLAKMLGYTLDFQLIKIPKK